MNILFSCDEYPPAKTGGIGTATKTVAEALVRRGHNVYVVSGRLDKNLPEETIINGVKVYRIYLMQKQAWLFKPNFFCNKLHSFILRFGLLAKVAIKEYKRLHAIIENIIQRHKIDIIEIPDYTILSQYYTTSTCLNSQKFSIPTIARVHGSISFLRYYRDGMIHPTTQLNDKLFFESVDKILSVSKFAADFVNKKLNVKNKCDIIYNPLVDTFINYAKGITVKRTNNIVFLGKIIETKGAFNLIKAFNQFSLKHPDYTLTMIGGGMLDKGKAIASNFTKDKIKFTGYLQPEEIASYLRSAAFCVIPTFFETLGVAALEVMGCENILIYTTTSSGPELINDGIDGFLVNPHDVDEISNKMDYVAVNIESLQSMREVAANKVKSVFSEQIIIDQLENYYTNQIS